MRSVAYVTTTFPTFARFIEDEVARLRERGVHVRVFTLRHVGRALHADHVALESITTTVGAPLDPRSWWALLRWTVRRPETLLPLAGRILRASLANPYALAGHLAYLPAAARVAGLVEREGIERVHGVWAHFPATVAFIAARLTGRRFSMAAHAGADLGRTRAFLAEKVAAADFVAVCVRRNADDLIRTFPSGRIACIYHGVDRKRFDGSGREPDQNPLLLGAGRLAREKGFDTAIVALAGLLSRGVDARLVLAGDGPERARLERLAHDAGVADRVAIPGFLPVERLLDLYRRAWILVAPSRRLPSGQQDGIPNVVVEALAMGLPCVGSTLAGIPEAVVPGETGVLCPPDDPEALTAALHGLVTQPGELERLGARARSMAREHFDTDRNFERFWQLFQHGPAPTVTS